MSLDETHCENSLPSPPSSQSPLRVVGKGMGEQAVKSGWGGHAGSTGTREEAR